MRDISRKTKTLRTAVAQATLHISPSTASLIRNNKVPKGNPFEVAKVAAVQGAKNTSAIIPYCHPIPVDFVGVDFALGKSEVVVTAEVKAIYKTGVEMEALTAASVAALTLYDMMKMLDEEMEITGVKLLSKRGGKSDFTKLADMKLRAAVLVLSDSISSGKNKDESGKLIVERLKEMKVTVADYKIIPDDTDKIEQKLLQYSDSMELDLVIATGGTGLGPRDNTPEAVKRVIEKEIPGIAETARAYGQERIPQAMLSRSLSGVRGKTLIVTLPGSKNAVEESLDALFPAVMHVCKMIRGGGH